MVTPADFIARAQAGRIRSFEVDGETLHVRKFTGSERRMLGERARAGNPMTGIEIAVLAACNEDGSPFMTVVEAQALDEACPELLERIVEEVLRGSGLYEKAVEEAAKNLRATPSA